MEISNLILNDNSNDMRYVRIEVISNSLNYGVYNKSMSWDESVMKCTLMCVV